MVRSWSKPCGDGDTGTFNPRRSQIGRSATGPETPELLERIARHRERHSDRRERRTLVSTLLRHVPSARPDRRIGELVAALAQAGVFRLRAVLVGTVAYQIYGPMLGLRLPHAGVRTGDLDIAQFREISVAVEDSSIPILNVLREVDPSFRDLDHVFEPGRTAAYRSNDGTRVEFRLPIAGERAIPPSRCPPSALTPSRCGSSTISFVIPFRRPFFTAKVSMCRCRNRRGLRFTS